MLGGRIRNPDQEQRVQLGQFALHQRDGVGAHGAVLVPGAIHPARQVLHLRFVKGIARVTLFDRNDIAHGGQGPGPDRLERPAIDGHTHGNGARAQRTGDVHLSAVGKCLGILNEQPVPAVAPGTVHAPDAIPHRRRQPQPFRRTPMPFQAPLEHLDERRAALPIADGRPARAEHTYQRRQFPGRQLVGFLDVLQEGGDRRHRHPARRLGRTVQQRLDLLEPLLARFVRLEVDEIDSVPADGKVVEPRLAERRLGRGDHLVARALIGMPEHMPEDRIILPAGVDRLAAVVAERQFGKTLERRGRRIGALVRLIAAAAPELLIGHPGFGHFPGKHVVKIAVARILLVHPGELARQQPLVLGRGGGATVLDSKPGML